MDAELMKAVKAVIDQWTLPAAEDEVQLSIERMESALTATVAEIRKRRAESVFVGPFTVEDYQDNGHDWFGINDSSVTCKEIRGGYADYKEAKRDCEMFNEFLGYDAQGNDLLEGMGI